MVWGLGCKVYIGFRTHKRRTRPLQTIVLTAVAVTGLHARAATLLGEHQLDHRQEELATPAPQNNKVCPGARAKDADPRSPSQPTPLKPDASAPYIRV